MNTRIVKSFTFDAAHQLPNHEGRCRRLHGHTYKVEVAFIGEAHGQTGESDEGMLVDFQVISDWWKGKIEPGLDHRFLNETIPDAYHPTTAENISRYIYDQAAAVSLYAEWVRVWETPTGYAEYPAHRQSALIPTAEDEGVFASPR